MFVVRRNITVTQGEISEATAYKPLSIIEINTLALDLVENRALASWQLSEEEKPHFKTVFMPLVMMDDIEYKQMLVDKIKHLYGYRSNTMPYQINCLPIFHTIGKLNHEDGMRVVKAMNVITRMREEFLKNDHS